MTLPSKEDADARVLSYHDVLLRRADLDLLRGPEWLNDQVQMTAWTGIRVMTLISGWMPKECLMSLLLCVQLIRFYFTYLLEELHPGLASRVCFMPPGTSFLLLNSDPSDAAVIFEALQLHEKELVVFAVNDNPDVEHAAGGSHWSCLCFHRPTNTFRHYDSSSAAGNRSVARQLAGAATPLVRSKGSVSGSTVQQPEFEQVAAMPSQQNGYDCGLYLCAVVQALCELLQCDPQAAAAAASTAEAEDLRGRFDKREQELLQSITCSSIEQLRQHMLELIEERAAQQQ